MIWSHLGEKIHKCVLGEENLSPSLPPHQSIFSDEEKKKKEKNLKTPSCRLNKKWKKNIFNYLYIIIKINFHNFTQVEIQNLLKQF